MKTNRKLTDEQIEEMRKRRDEGETLQQLADDYGVAHSTVWGKCREITKKTKKIAYKGLQNWVKKNKIKYREFADGVGMKTQQIHMTLQGVHEPRKTTIDKILKYTGMTYEEAFKEDGAGDA